MTTVARGDAFERRVHSTLERLLNTRRLGLDPDSARLFLKKGYYSRDRDSDIVVDVSIEVWPPDASNWWMLWVCECKDYSGPVSVDNIEEFKAKLDQITGANRKGLFAVSGALQVSAVQYARANGIGVMRILPDEQVEHLLGFDVENERRGDEASVCYQALTQPEFVGVNRSLYAEIDGQSFSNWGTMLRAMLGNVSPTGSIR